MLNRLELFLENQHPLVRSNLRLGFGIAGLVVLLNIGVLMAVRAVEARLLFKFNSAMQLFQTLLMLLIVMMGFNALKTAYHFMRGEGVFTAYSVFWAVFSLSVLGLSLPFLPNAFPPLVAYHAGESYNAVYEAFDGLCEGWISEWGESDNITLDVTQEDFGMLTGKGETYRYGNTVFVNFGGGEEIDFGLACAITNTPSTLGRANDYVYQQLEVGRYQFVESEKN